MNEVNFRFTITSPSGSDFKVRYTIYLTQKDNKKVDGVLYLGNPKTKKEDACVTITVHYPESLEEYRKLWDRDPLFDPSVASLVLTKYNPLCSEGKQLPSGNGTVEMIYVALSLIKQLCPFVTTVDLRDMSVRKCDDGTSISLSHFYITIYRQTWYEKKFSAKIHPINIHNEYRIAVDNLFSHPLEPFNTFDIHFLRKCQPHIITAIQTVYEASTTMGQFFKKLYETNGIPMGCILVNQWLSDLMRLAKIDQYVEHSWFIDMNIVPIWKFTETSDPLKIQRKIRGTRKNNIWTMGGRRRKSWKLER
jgi:hypothetical protein